MKLDKKTLDMLAALPDDKLWMMLRMVSKSVGAQIPDEVPDKEKMANLRNAMANIGEGDISRAMEIAQIYKGGKK